jgi:hypothetical protein
MSVHAFYTDAVTVPLPHGRPLLVVDADEVLLRFADGFDRYLRARDLYLDFASYRLHGNVKRMTDNSVPLDIEVTALIEEFRSDLDTLEPAEHAATVLKGLAPLLDIVVLSNVTPAQALPRRRNLDALGFAFPLLSNSGPKGHAVKQLAARAGKPAFFMDDIGQHHASVKEFAPRVWRIHFVADERLNPLMPTSPHAHYRARDWRDADVFIRGHLA